MNSEKKAIRLLAVTAVLLLMAIVLVPRSKGVDVAIKGGDYLIVTHKAAVGGDALYIADQRIGMLGVFVFDTNARVIHLRALRPIPDAFRMR